MGKTIQQFDVPAVPGAYRVKLSPIENSIGLKLSAEDQILHVRLRDAHVVAWALVDTKLPPREFIVNIVQDGQSVDDWAEDPWYSGYVGSDMLPDSSAAIHVFVEEITTAPYLTDQEWISDWFERRNLYPEMRPS